MPFFSQQTSVDELDEGRVGRVTEVHRSRITVVNETGEFPVSLQSSWQSGPAESRPTVGDWVVLDRDNEKLSRVLERKSVFRRVAAGEKTEIQLISANVDILFIVTSCNDEFNESRLERYLATAAEAIVTPVVVLTKIDLTDDPDAYLARACAVQSGLAVELVNALDKSTFDGLRAWIEPGITVALVGSSGVGKSTILNTLLGENAAATREVREADKKGRHTTTYRAMHRLHGGGLLIDVPGMREFKVVDVDAALGSVFADVESLAALCRFADCRHGAEPGCAVVAAVVRGELDDRRLRNYLGLLRETERNSASLAEKRSQGRSFAKVVKQAKQIKNQQR